MDGEGRRWRTTQTNGGCEPRGAALDPDAGTQSSARAARHEGLTPMRGL